MANQNKYLNYIFTEEEGKHIFFTSDTHFNHDNIINFCARPYGSVEEMNEDLIRRWNEKVGKNDIVFHLGDFAWGGATKWIPILERLNGHIILCLGNHDEANIKPTAEVYFKDIRYQYKIMVGNIQVYLNHHPFLTWGGVYRKNVWQFFGHVHSVSKDNPTYNTGTDASRIPLLFPNQYDVGCDLNNYTPLSFNEVREIITKQIEEYETKSHNIDNEQH